MISPLVVAYIRYAATIALVSLTAIYQAYPHWVWLPIVISTLGTLGIHVIPVSNQVSNTVQMPVNPLKGQ